ncbi:UNVERIFIED_CONTAM: hypothetical protein HDU68_011707 [Siphonaria sp. JEL0065]|nr:hypothetical protein HDU68_011707 [Siphonaria sp. JEL0065]
MNLKLTLALLAGALGVSAACTSPNVRREWGQLSSSEKSQYVASIKALNARPRSFQYTNPSVISYSDFTSTHAANAWWAHANAEFLVYHRAMLVIFEKAMHTVGWNGGIVYLDEAAHQSKDWINLDLFSNQYFGGEGQSGQCLGNGQFSSNSGFQVLADNGGSQCVTRCGGGSFFDAYTVVGQIAGASDYEGVRSGDISNFHANGHFVLGGGNCDMGNPSWSPRDPLFFLHHAYIDKYYWKWQMLCPNHYVTSYNGNYQTMFDFTNPASGNGQPVSPSVPLDSWAPLTAADVFDTRSDFLCYSYSQSAGDVGYSHVNCPDGSAPNYTPWSNTPPPPPVNPPVNPPVTTQAATQTDSNGQAVTTSSAAASPLPTLISTNIDDQWLLNNFKLLLVHAVGQSLSFNVGGRDNAANSPPRPSASSSVSQHVGEKKNGTRAAVREQHYMLSQGPNNTTIVTVTTKRQSVEYTIPSGCQLHKVFHDRISILPAGFVYDDAVGLPVDNPCPIVLHRPCDSVPVCKRYPGYKEPTATSKCQYARILSNTEIKLWNMDLCMVRKSDCKMRWAVDKCNAEA